jgi:hypothetical protein
MQGFKASSFGYTGRSNATAYSMISQKHNDSWGERAFLVISLEILRKLELDFLFQDVATYVQNVVQTLVNHSSGTSMGNTLIYYDLL